MRLGFLLIIALSAGSVLGQESEMKQLPVPKIADFDERAGEFQLDERYHLKQPDWTYADETSA